MICLANLSPQNSNYQQANIILLLCQNILQKLQWTTQKLQLQLKNETYRWGYSLLLMLISVFAVIPALISVFKSDKNATRRKFQRLGFQSNPGQHDMLIHCVSVGEVVVAAKLVNQLLKQNPSIKIIITTTTQTGKEQVEKLFGDKITHRYLPFDTPFNMQRLMRQASPKKIVIIEVELWPNLIHYGFINRIPIYVINARMTDKSLRSYQKLSALFAPMIDKIVAIGAQGKRDFNNYQALGMPTNRLHLCNNIKFDIANEVSSQQHALIQQLYNPDGRQVLICGSTHEPEEEMLLACLTELKKRDLHPLLVLVPRHPQRFEQVEKLLSKSDFSYTLSSHNNISMQDVILVDEMGALSSLYAIANIAFVGGSFASRGGHNALEAAIHAVPVIMGPSIYNNPEICHQLEAVGALKIVHQAAQLNSTVVNWLTDETSAKSCGAAGKNVIESNRGAIEKSMQLLNDDTLSLPIL